jgi:hypothetical protein
VEGRGGSSIGPHANPKEGELDLSLPDSHPVKRVFISDIIADMDDPFWAEAVMKGCQRLALIWRVGWKYVQDKFSADDSGGGAELRQETPDLTLSTHGLTGVAVMQTQAELLFFNPRPLGPIETPELQSPALTQVPGLTDPGGFNPWAVDSMISDEHRALKGFAKPLQILPAPAREDGYVAVLFQIQKERDQLRRKSHLVGVIAKRGKGAVQVQTQEEGGRACDSQESLNSVMGVERLTHDMASSRQT